MSKQTVEEAAASVEFPISKYGDKQHDYITDYERAAFVCGAAWQREQGIDWISVDTKPAIHDISGIGGYSRRIILANDINWSMGQATFTSSGDFDKWIGATFIPTHWAKINLPTTDK